MQTIHYLNRNMGITVVSITHYMEEAAQADRVLVMSKGHVVMEGTPKRCSARPRRCAPCIWMCRRLQSCGTSW